MPLLRRDALRFKPNHPFSRRSFVRLGLGAALGFAAVPATAQTEWQILRRPDLGFEVEMPGQPEIDTETSDGRDEVWVRTIIAEVAFDDDMFGVSYQEFKTAPSLSATTAVQHLMTQFPGARLERETALTLNGYRAIEFVIASETFHALSRAAVVGNAVIVATVVSPDPVADNEPARRFVHSLKLLAR